VGSAGAGQFTGLRDMRVKDGARIVELTVPAGGSRDLSWTYAD
jgi:hypothetical protein